MAVTAPNFIGDTYTTTINSIPGAAIFGRTAAGVWLPALAASDGSLEVVISSGGTDQDVNIAAVAGVATPVGNGAAATALRVAVADTYPPPTPASTAGLGIANVVSTALETGHVIKNSAGNLYGFTVTTTTVAGYAQIFNSTTVPAAGAVTPVDTFYVGAFGSVSRTYDPPLVCATGISIAFSSAVTPFTKTDSATAFISGQAV